MGSSCLFTKSKSPRRLRGDGEGGFTLVELLVVMLILGILAAIALPAFFTQKNKAIDAKAKENAHSAQVAMESCSTDNSGNYAECTAATRKTIEPTLPPPAKENLPGESLAVSKATETGFRVTVTSVSGNTFTVQKKSGELKFFCTVEDESSRGGCPASGTWGG